MALSAMLDCPDSDTSMRRQTAGKQQDFARHADAAGRWVQQTCRIHISPCRCGRVGVCDTGNDAENMRDCRRSAWIAHVTTPAEAIRRQLAQQTPCRYQPTDSADASPPQLSERLKPFFIFMLVIYSTVSSSLSVSCLIWSAMVWFAAASTSRTS